MSSKSGKMWTLNVQLEIDQITADVGITFILLPGVVKKFIEQGT